MDKQPVTTLKGVGESTAQLLRKLGIQTVEQLIYHVPRRYDDYSKITKIHRAKPGLITLEVQFKSVTKRYSKQGTHITEAIASDDTGSIAVVWFNQPYRATSIKPNVSYYISGEYGSSYRQIGITNPSVELVSTFPLNTARLVPQYRLTKGLTNYLLRKYVKDALLATKMGEILPLWMVQENHLMPRETALYEIHFPSGHENLEKAKYRLGFEEVFELSLASQLNKQQFAENKGIKLSFSEKLISTYVSSLPFSLTPDQRKVAWQVLKDLEGGTPMNRLVEGDVGSGKTVIASIGLMQTQHHGYQTAFMAPTEILARQHFETLKKLLPKTVSTGVVMISGGLKKKQKEVTRKLLADGKVHTAVGTHALLTELTQFKNLGLVIVDEQHRFGVEQRKKLQAKAHEMPHVLHMTATPIPRSLALTLYGELDISILQTMPPGRKPVITSLYQPEQRAQVYKEVEKAIAIGGQAFVVCPKIEDQEGLDRNLSVTHITSQLHSSFLKGYRIVTLHGKLSAEEKEAIMKDFIDRKYDILVSTTVIEVGVDIPNATVMVIEGADKFGLAQLHQLRGRVGRGNNSGHCYLISTVNGPPTNRLSILSKETNGFRLADYDLEIRGPGAIYGTMQHGALDLRIAKLTDVKLIRLAKSMSLEFMKRNENLLHYDELAERIQRLRAITNLN
jgi:ATP-dependent DNA helicase RecG